MSQVDSESKLGLQSLNLRLKQIFFGMIDFNKMRWHISLTEKEETKILKHTRQWYLYKTFVFGSFEYENVILHHRLDYVHIVLCANTVRIVINISLNIQSKGNIIIIIDLLIAGDLFRYVFSLRL